MARSPYHTDFWSRQDHLQFSDYRPVLSDILMTAETPLTMAIFGPWGSGKTTLLKMLQRDIEATGLYRTLWFTAWKFDRHEALWRAFLLRVLDTLYPRELGDDPWENRQRLSIEKMNPAEIRLVSELQRMEESIYRAVDWEEYGDWKVNWWQALSQTGKGAAEIATALFPPAGAIKPILEILDGVGNQDQEFERKAAAIRREVRNYHREQLRSMEQFEQSFQEALSLGLGEEGRLVIFVDDLDRCLPEKAVEILETIKLFLEVDGAVFVLGMDKEVIERGIEVHYQAFFNTAIEDRPELPIRSEAYLQKIVQIPFYLPPMGEDDIDGFIISLESTRNQVKKPIDLEETRKLLAETRQMTQETRRALSSGLLPNPRQVKRVLNIFRLLQGVAIVREDKNSLPKGSVSWPLLAKTVVIQTQFPRLYRTWRREPMLVPWLEAEYFKRAGTHQLTASSEALENELEPRKQQLLEDYLDPKNWQKYRLLERMLSAQGKSKRSNSRDKSSFAELTPPQVAVYLRLAGSVALEDAIPDYLVELRDALRRNQGRARKLLESMSDGLVKEDRDFVRWFLQSWIDTGVGNKMQRVFWAESIGHLGDLSRSIELLDQQIEEEEPRIRVEAIAALGRLQNRQAVFRIINGFTNPSGLVRNASADSLAKANKELHPVIFEHVDDPNQLIRSGIADTLGKMPNRQTFKYLTELYADESVEVRVTSARSLSNFDNTNALSMLFELLRDDSEDVRSAASESLATKGDVAATELVNQLADLELETNEQQIIEKTLIRLGKDAVVPVLGKLKTQSEEEIIDSLESVLTRIGKPAVGVLTTYLKRQSSPVMIRQTAARVLGKIKDTKALESLVAAIEDRSPLVREASSKALINMGNASAPLLITELYSHARDKEKSISYPYIVKALGGIGEFAVEELSGGLTHEKVYVRKAMVDALAAVGTDAAVSHLLSSLISEQNAGVRNTIIDALGELGNPVAIQPLNELLAQSDLSNAFRQRISRTIRKLEKASR